MLFDARGKATVHLTYPTDEIDVERKKDWEELAKEQKRKAKKPSVNIRPAWSAEANSLGVFFNQVWLAPR